ncbi:hypothetical protein DUNSADRAFT_625 [Dunaliella salina]|uniref:Redox-regulatory protein FAM213A n=1 Tax=Dunaliella salina TaxID=3046 RepID=A0ABQ7FYK8_DUNSA|nr:hypothetical protein DUNSADRAFT_625 [Dunaliella salina]|eukprot:KAF5827455.1 hypothetical protein DUNSADRAFT_625 [Dunaliella salina]
MAVRSPPITASPEPQQEPPKAMDNPTSLNLSGPKFEVQHLSTAALANVKLWNKQAGTFKASALWKQGPVVLVMLRRTGCVLCRYQARELWGLKDLLK